MSEADELHAVSAANDAFYAAFAAGRYDDMRKLWAETTPILCIHPGAPALHGRPAVLGSWREILAEPPVISYSEPQVTLVRGLAFVTCLEHIEGGTLMASNIFVWEDGAWRLVHHHSGAIAGFDESDPPPAGHLH